MGYVQKFFCKKCGYKGQFRLGAGRRDCEFEHVLSHYNEMDADSLKFLSFAKKADFLSFQYQLGCCRSCGKLAEVPMFSFQDGSQFTGGVCECGISYEEGMDVTLSEKEIKCPVCGEVLNTTIIGFWD